MHVLIVNKKGQAAKHISLLSIAFSFLLLTGLTASLVYYYADLFLPQQGEYHIPVVNDTNQQVLSILQQEQESTRQLQQQLDVQLETMTVQIARMQAKLIQLDNIGESLVKKGDLDSEILQDAMAVAVGGPEEEERIVSMNTRKKMAYIEQRILDVASEINTKAEHLHILETLIDGQSFQETMNPAGKPAERGWISSYFGKRKDPFSGKLAQHKGIDVAGKSGSNIIATAKGVVTWAGNRSGYGELIEINHGNQLLTRYGHCKEILVTEGQIVEQGDVIGKIGSTGRSTGPHIHYEVIKNGRKLNPIKYVRKQRQSKNT